MKFIILLFVIFIVQAQSFLSKEWVTKEMSCFKKCIVEKNYDAYYLSNTHPQQCHCKVVTFRKKECRYLTEDEYLDKFKNFKKYYIKNKIVPMFKRYKKYYPSNINVLNEKRISLLPTQNAKNIILNV